MTVMQKDVVPDSGGVTEATAGEQGAAIMHQAGSDQNITVTDDAADIPHHAWLAGKFEECGIDLVALGHADGVQYFLTGLTSEVVPLPASRLRPPEIYRLAPEWAFRAIYSEVTDPKTGKTSVNLQKAASQLIEACASAGPFSTSKARGRGIWRWQDPANPDAIAIMFTGAAGYIVKSDNSLKGPMKPAALFRETGLIFPHGEAKIRGEVLAAAAPLDDYQMREWVDNILKFRWENRPLAKYLVPGWIVSGLLAGYSNWRSHMWITGRAGSGKTTLAEDVISPIVWRLGHIYSGETSEAGMRQDRGGDAIPIFLDEAEGDDDKGHRRIAAIISSGRSMSRTNRAKTAKGTPGGGALQFQSKGQLLFSSVNHQLEAGADISRFTLCSLSAAPNQKRTQAEIEAWEVVLDYFRRCDSDAFAAALLRRVLAYLPAWDQTVRIFRTALIVRGASDRQADQLSTLLAGGWVCQAKLKQGDNYFFDEPSVTCINNNVDTLMQAGLSDQISDETDEADDAKIALTTLLNLRVEVICNDRAAELTIWEAIERRDEKNVREGLDRIGIEADDDTLYLSTRSAAVGEVFARGGKWKNWGGPLSGLPGAVGGRGAARRSFRLFGQQRTVELPIALFQGPYANDEPEEMSEPEMSFDDLAALALQVAE